MKNYLLNIIFRITLVVTQLMFLSFYSCGQPKSHTIKLETLDSTQKTSIYNWTSFRFKSSANIDSITTQCEKRLVVRWKDTTINLLPLETGTFVLKFLKLGIAIDSFTFVASTNSYFKEEWKKVKDGVTPTPLTTEQYRAWKNYYEYKMLYKKVPDFKTVNVYGDTLTNSNFIGKTTVINFWEYGCMPCMAEIPSLNKLKLEFNKDSTIQFISFYRDMIRINPVSKTLEFQSKEVSAEALKHSIYFRPAEFDYMQIPNSKETNLLFNVWGFPTNMVIDRNGIIKQIFIGASIDSNDKLIAEIKSVIQHCK